MHCFVLSPLFSSIWRMQYIWSVVDLLLRNPHWWSPVISSAYGVNLNSRMLDKILHVVDASNMPVQLLQSCCIALLNDRYNDRLLPLLRQFFLIPNRSNMFMDLRANCHTPCFNQICLDLTNTRWSVPSSVLYRHLNCKGTGLKY
jgi:hypothetical protein